MGTTEIKAVEDVKRSIPTDLMHMLKDDDDEDDVVSKREVLIGARMLDEMYRRIPAEDIERFDNDEVLQGQIKAEIESIKNGHEKE